MIETNETSTASATQKDKVEALQHLMQKLDAALFAEEYEHMCDSTFEARVRRKGINPMNDEYVEKTNLLRVRLGFTPINIGADDFNDDTYPVSLKLNIKHDTVML